MNIFPSVHKHDRILAKKSFSLALFLALIVQTFAPAFLYGGFFIPTAYAQEEAEAVQDNGSAENEEAEAAPAEETPTEAEEVATEIESVTEAEATPAEETPTAEVSEEETKTETAAPVEEKSTWQTEGDKATTTEAVKAGVTYEAPQNKDVTVTFTKLPETPGTLSIEEIALTKEQIEATGSLSDKAYDITSSMENGSFEYELTLPIPEGKDNVQVKYAEDVAGLKDADTVDLNDVKTEGDSVTAELNHFTVFVVTGVDNSGSCAGAVIVTVPGDSCYTDLQVAVNAANPGDTIELTADITTSAQVTITKALTIDGNGHTLFSNFSKTDNSNNSGIGIIGTTGVTIEEITFNGTGGTNLHGINIYESSANLTNVTSRNYRSGVVVNSSQVTVTNITTANNSWHGINVDYVTQAAALTINGTSSHSGETANILVDDITETVTVNDINSQYTSADFGNTRIYTLAPDTTPPSIPGQIGWTTENPPVGSDYTGGTDFADYKTCSQSVNYSPMTNLWAPSTDTNGPVSYEREVYSPDANTLIYSHSLTTNYVNGGGAVDGGTYWVRVRAVDALGNTSDWTPKCAVTFDVTVPSSPIHESPADNSSINYNDFYFQWTDVSDAVEYEFQTSQNSTVDGNGELTTGVWNNKLHGGPDRNYLTNSEIHSYGANGTWYWQVRARDATGNWGAWTSPWKLTIDMVAPVAPTVTVNESGGDVIPNGGLTNSYGITVNWTAIADAISYEYRYSNSIPGNPYNVPNYYPVTGITGTSLSGVFNQGDGLHHVEVRALDAAGNPSPWSTLYSINYDGTAPAIPTLVSPANGVPVNGTNPIANDWETVADAHHYIYQSYNVDGSGNCNLSSIRFTSNYTDSQTNSRTFADGLKFCWRVKSVDTAGNESGWSELWKTIADNSAPSVPVHMSPADNTFTTTALQTSIDWQDSTDANSPVKYQYQSSTSTLTNGDGSFSSPAYTSGELTDSMISTLGTPEGVYYWHVRAKDTAGNWSAWSTPWKITVDNTMPTVDLVFPTPGPAATSFQAVFTEDVNVSEAENPANYFLTNWPQYSASSGDLVGDATISYNPLTKTATITFIDSGWYVSAEQEWGVQNIHDLAGNLQAVNPYSETSTPMVAPVTTDSGTDANWHNAPVTVTLTCGDGPSTTGSGCKTTYYTTDGNDPTTGSAVYTSPIVISAEGITTIKYFSVDNAGNTEVVKTAANTIKIDTTLPTDPTSVTSTSHLTGVWSGDGTVDVTWSGATDTLSGVDGFYTEWNNSPDTMTGPKVKEYEETATSETSPLFASGQSYYFHIATLDNAGNWTSTAHLGPFQIDRTNPTVTWTDPSSVISYVGGAAVDLAVNAFDAHSGVQNVTFAYSSFPFFSWIPVAVDAVSPYATTWDTTGLADGLYSLRAVVRDNVNRTAQAFRLVITDNTNPITTDSGTDANWHNTDVTVTLSCTDGFLIGSGCDTTYYTTDGSTPTTASSVYTSPIVISTEGVTTIQYFSTDNVGNEESIKTAANTVKIDKTIPTVSYSISPTDPDGDNDWYTSIPTVTLTADDGVLSGVDHIEYRLNGGAWTTYVSPFTLVDGVWTVEYRAFDVATNESATGSSSAKVDTTDPDEVNNLDAEYRASQDDIKISWDADDNDIDRVLIYRGGSSGFNVNSGNRIGNNDDNDDTFNDGDVAFGATYYYKLVSVDEAGNHSGSKVIKVEMPAAPAPGGTAGPATVTQLGTEGVAEGTVLGEQTENNEGGEATTEDGEVMGATDNGAVNGLMDYLKNHPWWSLLWLLILLLIAYLGYKRYVQKQNPIA